MSVESSNVRFCRPCLPVALNHLIDSEIIHGTRVSLCRPDGTTLITAPERHCPQALIELWVSGCVSMIFEFRKS